VSNQQIALIVLVLAVGVWVTRFLPFAVFKNISKLPQIIGYFEKVLPPAMMGLLVVYCMQDDSFYDATEIVPVLLSVAVVAVVHLIRRNTILSISVGTALYMILIRVM